MLRIVIAGISRSRIQGASSKNFSRVAYPLARISVSGKTKSNSPFSSRKTIMAIYPVRLLND